jgi:hypothetical protein
MERIAVLGMGRSGTSYLAELLSACGVFADGVTGKHEHELGRLINDTILAREFGARPGRPYGRLSREEIVLSGHWERMAGCFVQYMDARAASAGNGARYWVFKDPRTTILHHIWAPHFGVFVGIFRAPQDVAASFIGRGWIRGWRRSRIALEYWKRFNQSLLHLHRTVAPTKRFLLLDYDGDLDRQTAALCERLGLPRPEAARRLYQSGLKHYTRPALPRDREARQIYQALMDLRLVPS